MTPFLTLRQIAILSSLGALLWLVAALLLRWLEPMGIYEGAARIWLYLAIVPGTLPFVWLLIRAAGLHRSQALAGVATALTVAVLLDGVALAWFPALYGPDAAALAGAGATLLWGAGIFLVLGAAVGRFARG